jgi:hypothetical protein
MYINQWVNKINIPLSKDIAKTIYPQNTGTNHTPKENELGTYSITNSTKILYKFQI